MLNTHSNAHRGSAGWLVLVAIVLFVVIAGFVGWGFVRSLAYTEAERIAESFEPDAAYQAVLDAIDSCDPDGTGRALASALREGTVHEPEWYRQLSVIADNTGHYAHAAALITAGRGHYGQDAWDRPDVRALWWQYTFGLLNAGQYDQASSLAGDLLAAAPGEPQNVVQSIEFSYSMAEDDVLSRIEAARNRFESENVAPKYSAALYRLEALAYLDEDNPEAAKPAIESAAELEPADAEIYLTWSQTLHREALNEELSASRWRDVDKRDMLPKLREVQEKLDRAVELAKRDRLSEMAYYWQEKARVYTNMSQYEDAMDALLHALGYRPNDSVSKKMLTGLYNSQGRLDEARALISGNYTIREVDGYCRLVLSL